MERLGADRCVWEGAPLSLVTFSCLLCCLGHREQGSQSGKPALMSEQEKAEKDNKERQDPAPHRHDSECRAASRRPGS